MDADNFSLSVAEALLNAVIATAPKFGRVGDVDFEMDFSAPDDTYTAFSIDPINARLIVSYLLSEQVRFERELLESVQVIDTPFRHKLILVANEDGAVYSGIGAVIDDTDLGMVVIELSPPVIYRLIRGYGKCTACDVVRVATVLVRFGCQYVGSFGFPESVFGDLVGFLRFAIRDAREDQRDKRGNGSNPSSNVSHK